MNYHHKQTGWVIISIISPIIVVLLAISILGPRYPEILLTGLLMLLALALFYCLTISVNSKEIKFSFGIGLIRKTISIDDIESAAEVRNHWYYGWGIRWFGKGWLYNVSGLDAVELRLKNGKLIRLGTDEPEQLLRAVKVNMGIG